MDILTLSGFVFAGLLILLGLVLVLRHNSQSKEIEKKQLPPLDADEKIDIGLDSLHSAPVEDSIPSATASSTLEPASIESIALDDQLSVSDVKVSASPSVVPDLQQTTPQKATSQPSHATPADPSLVSNSNTQTIHAIHAQKAIDSELLENHIEEERSRDRHSALSQAEKIIALYLLPKGGAISGESLLSILREYGLRFGEMSLFHRYQEVDGSGPLMFSVLKYAPTGEVTSFDLESLVNDEIEGLAFFLALPNSVALKGFDTMMHMSEHIARRLNADIFDEERCRMTRQSYEYTRQQVIKYI